MRMHECRKNTCHNLIAMNKNYCEQHQKLEQELIKKRNKDYNANRRDKEANSFYHSKAWQLKRKQAVLRNNYISEVSNTILNDKDIIVDHIVPRRVDKDKELDINNLWLLSRREHNIKTRIEDRILAKPNGVNIIRHLDKAWWIKNIKQDMKGRV